MDNLLRIQLDGPDLVEWDPKCAIELWWKDKVRRIRFESQQSTSTDTEQQDQVQIVSNDSNISLEDWETWLNN